MLFKRLFLVVISIILILCGEAFTADWSQITGKCILEKETIVRKGTTVKMLTERGGKIILEETKLKTDRKGVILSCETGTYVRLDECGNLIVISEKSQKEKVVIIERERTVYEPQYIERPVYVSIERPVPVYVPPPPPIWVPSIHLYFHYERHHYRFHPYYSRPDPPRVTTLPPRVY